MDKFYDAVTVALQKYQDECTQPLLAAEIAMNDLWVGLQNDLAKVKPSAKAYRAHSERLWTDYFREAKAISAKFFSDTVHVRYEFLNSIQRITP